MSSDELVSQFMAFTGSADPSRAASYLEMSGGDLQTAVGLYMEHETGGTDHPGGGGDTTTGARDSARRGGGGLASARGSSTAMGGGDFVDVRAPDETRRMRLMDDQMMMPADPSFHLMNAMMEEQFQSAFAAAPFADLDARAAVNAAAERAKENQHDDVDDNHDGESKAIDVDDEDDDDGDDEEMGGAGTVPPRLSDMFAAPTHLMHKAGGFQGARTVAKDSKRWLLVNIQRDSEFSSHALNRDVWRDELVENLIREGFIFWQTMDVTPEGRTYVERYQVQDYPHIGIIDPRTGRLMWRKEGWTQQNPVTAESFAEMAMDFCSRNSFDRPPQAPRPAAASSARPTKRPMRDMTEQEQIEAAMKASIEDITPTDMTDDDVVEVVEDNSEESKPAAAPTKTLLNDELVAMALGDEPADGARLQLRMPDGKRVVRKFAPTDSVKNIYAFVAQSNDEASGGKEFVLMAGFPPKDLFEDIDKTIDECKLSGQAVTIRWK